MKKLSVVLISCALFALTVSPLSQAQNQTPTTARNVIDRPSSSLAQLPPLSPRPFRQETGDLNTLVGTGQATVGVAVAEPKTDVNKSAETMRPTLSAEQLEERERLREDSRRHIPIPTGPLAPPASIPPPTTPSVIRQLSGEEDVLPLAPNDMTVFRSHNLTSGEAPLSQRSNVQEPTTINLDSAVFYTANWYASKSVNGGSTFTYINPYNFFPSVNGGFCCDQVTAYAPNQDMALWGLQYLKDSNSGTFRLARAIGSTGIANNNWIYYDFNPQNVGFSNGNWFDYPSLTVGSNYLYITSNVYSTASNNFTGSVIMRVPLSNVAAGTSFSYSYFSSTNIVGTFRPTDGATTTMYWAAFPNTTQMRIHRWDESSGSVFWDDVQLQSFTYYNSGGVAISPDGTNWAGHSDSRPMAAYVAGGIIGVMFMARQDANFPYPYTIHARFSESTRALVSQGAIWNANYAWLYPSATTNAAGHIAGTLQVGGGTPANGAPYPGTTVWVSDDVQPGGTTVGGIYGIANSTAGPSDNSWGDYFSTRRHKAYPNTWVLAAHTLQGGNTGSFSVPNYTWFGREKNGPASATCPAPSAISFGQTVSGTLAGNDCVLPNGIHYDAYTFSGTAGQQIVISQSSSAFDSYVYLLGTGGAALAEDDDGGGGNNSRIPASSGSLTLPSTGTYTIRASSFSAGSAGTYSLSLALNSTPTTSGLQYYPLATPVRLLDTRAGTSACDTPASPLTAGGTRTEPARIPCTGIPAAAQAIVGNATVVNNTGAGAGFVTLFPNGVAQPTVSNLNYSAGQIVPNAFTVGLGTGGAFNIYASSGIHFIVDIAGYYAPPGTGGLYYHPLASPVRLLDTRPGTSACDTPATPLTAGVARSELARRTCGSTTIPADALAIVGNATVVNNTGAGAGFVTLYPSNAARPTVSNLNYLAAEIIPNAFTVGLGTDGAFNIYASSGINFIVDVAGYYSNQATDINGTGLLFTPQATPVRLLDTRAGTSACDTPASPLTAGGTRTEPARIPCTGIPAAAQAIVGNATVVNNTGAGAGFVTLFPNGVAQPTVSNLNYSAGQIVPNAFTVGLGTGGAFNIYASSGIHFIVDIAGYFAP